MTLEKKRVREKMKISAHLIFIKGLKKPFQKLKT